LGLSSDWIELGEGFGASSGSYMELSLLKSSLAAFNRSGRSSWIIFHTISKSTPKYSCNFKLSYYSGVGLPILAKILKRHSRNIFKNGLAGFRNVCQIKAIIPFRHK